MSGKQSSDGSAQPLNSDQREALARLQQPDAIFQRDVFQSLVRFINLGGVPQDAIEGFSTSYRGVPVMCNLVSEWLQVAGVSGDQVEQMTRSHFRHLVLKHFDPNKTDQIFAAMSSAPDWLKEMIGHDVWRNMLYTLSEMHNNCLMLNLAIQLTSDAGFNTEMASLSTAASNFAVFNSVVLEHLRRISQSKTEETLKNQIEEFATFCSHGQHTYVYIQALLHRLSSEFQSTAFLRLIEDISAISQKQSNLSLKLSLLLTDAYLYPDAAAGIASIIESGNTNAADISKIHKQYSQPNPPPARLLRHKTLFDTIIRDLFNPKREIAPAFIERYVYVLAFASAADDDRVFKPGSTEVLSGSLSLEKFKETQSALMQTVQICRKNLTGIEMMPHLDQIVSHMQHPVIRISLVAWLTMNLSDKSFFVSNHLSSTQSTYVLLIKRVIPMQTFESLDILNLLTQLSNETVSREGTQFVELQKDVINLFIDLLLHGDVEKTASALENWLGSHDTAYSRHCVAKMLSLVEPPFSAYFVNFVLRLAQLANLIEPVHRCPDIRAVMSSFLGSIAEQAASGKEIDGSLLSKIQEIYRATAT
eukprot:TRINITY_DN1053_c0_g1_i2.p1 TRINITY_DN1053_c0_g1~~TRINITY_DN1053_c0_g1_i2.p1  ORF type:complete len:589 (-),score=103.46 TRINITY_DN1053_c0_g1_i2:383-2149(-)